MIAAIYSICLPIAAVNDFNQFEEIFESEESEEMVEEIKIENNDEFIVDTEPLAEEELLLFRDSPYNLLRTSENKSTKTYEIYISKDYPWRETWQRLTTMGFYLEEITQKKVRILICNKSGERVYWIYEEGKVERIQ